jgi:hypothetical protein
MRSGIFLEHRVRIDAAEAEGIDPRPPGRLAGAMNPRPRLGIQIEIALLQLQLRAGILAMQRGRQHFMVQRQSGLDQAGHARSRHGMADHGLHRAQRAPRDVAAAQPEHVVERFQFDHVAHRRGRAVRLDQFQAGQIHIGRFIGPPEGQLFPFQARRQ